MNSSVPVTYLAASDRRYSAPEARSFGSPRSPIGICALYHSTCSGVTFACIGVFTPPGTMVFTRTPCPTYSSAATLVIERTADLVAASLIKPGSQMTLTINRKSAVAEKRVSVRVGQGGRRVIKKKKN